MDWLSCNNHTKNQDQEIMGMNVNIHTFSTAVDTPICTPKEGMRAACSQDADMQSLKTYVIRGCPCTKDDVELISEKYW